MREVLLVLIITAMACAIPGVFLVLKGLSMITDAISHSVLLGIVLAFFLTGDLQSPLLLAGASIFGVLTGACIEYLSSAAGLSKDSSVGIVFPLFFSTGVILISKFARNAHLDMDMVLMGEVILSPFRRFQLGPINVPYSFALEFLVLLGNVIFLLVFFRQLKISTFDEDFAKMAGIALVPLYYGFMAMVSLTAVSAFDSVGAMLSISFLIAPAASACLLTKDLKSAILLSLVYALINSCAGFALALRMNISISGTCAAMSGLTFLGTLLLYPQGLLGKALTRIKNKVIFGREMLIFHMKHHAASENQSIETGFTSMPYHVDWQDLKLQLYLRPLIKKGYVFKNIPAGRYELTKKGLKLYYRIKIKYSL